MFITHQQEVLTVYEQQLVRVTRLGWLAAGRVKVELVTYLEAYSEPAFGAVISFGFSISGTEYMHNFTN
jgi:hypothetical protein